VSHHSHQHFPNQQEGLSCALQSTPRCGQDLFKVKSANGGSRKQEARRHEFLRQLPRPPSQGMCIDIEKESGFLST